jgi:hypothetical protein
MKIRITKDIRYSIRECLLAGKTESPLITLDESLILAEIMQVKKKLICSNTGT